MRDLIIKAVSEHAMLRTGDTVLCAISGGADSVCMTAALSELSPRLGISLCAAHFNHGLRALDSDFDEAFSAEFCRGLNIPFVSEKGDASAYAAQCRRSVEEAARELRYAFLNRAAQKLGSPLIATAHTADDSLETVLFNLCRGTGLSGLCGIPPKRGNIIRPLIRASRADVLKYLDDNGLSYRNDRSNDSDEYTRNRIRRHVVPALVKIAPFAIERVSENQRALLFDAAFIAKEALSAKRSAVYRNGEILFPASDLANLPPALSGRLIRNFYEELGGGAGEFSLSHALSVLEICRKEHPSKRVALPGGIVAGRRYESIVFSKKTVFPAISPFELLPDGKIRGIPGTNLLIECKKPEIYKILTSSHDTFYLDCDRIEGNLFVRSRQEGDRISLFSGGGSKTLKKLFIERRIPRPQREAVPVIADERGVAAVYGFGVNVGHMAQNAANSLYIRIWSAENE